MRKKVKLQRMREYGDYNGASGGGIAAGLLQDLFTDSDGIAIASHAMDIGSGWTLLQGAGTIQLNKLESGTSGTAMIIDAPSAYSDGVVSMDVTIPGSGEFGNALLVRMSDANTGWAIILENDGVSTTLSIVEMGGLI